jgi:hypothetical protein
VVLLSFIGDGTLTDRRELAVPERFLALAT